MTTETFSPMLTPAFERIMPSMRMMPLLSSSCAARNTFAAVDRLPTISITSPTSTERSLRVLVSILARSEADLGLVLRPGDPQSDGFGHSARRKSVWRVRKALLDYLVRFLLRTSIATIAIAAAAAMEATATM